MRYPLLFTSLCSMAGLQDNWEHIQQSSQPSHASLVWALLLLPSFKLNRSLLEPQPTDPSFCQPVGIFPRVRSKQARSGLQEPALHSSLARPLCCVWFMVNIPVSTTGLWHSNRITQFHLLLPITSAEVSVPSSLIREAEERLDYHQLCRQHIWQPRNDVFSCQLLQLQRGSHKRGICWICAMKTSTLEEAGFWINTFYDITEVTQNHLLYLLAERQFSTCKLIIVSLTHISTKREGGHEHFQH